MPKGRYSYQRQRAGRSISNSAGFMDQLFDIPLGRQPILPRRRPAEAAELFPALFVEMIFIDRDHIAKKLAFSFSFQPGQPFDLLIDLGRQRDGQRLGRPSHNKLLLGLTMSYYSHIMIPLSIERYPQLIATSPLTAPSIEEARQALKNLIGRAVF